MVKGLGRLGPETLYRRNFGRTSLTRWVLAAPLSAWGRGVKISGAIWWLDRAGNITHATAN